jgi:small-conductance mechanosensitive channel
MFSIGSSSFISNTIAGYALTYRRAFKVGDRVKINDVVGDVTEMRLQVTQLRSLKNEEVIIPNSLILNNQVGELQRGGRKGGVILHTEIGIGYETPWRQVEAMLLLAAERTARILQETKHLRAAEVSGDFCIDYELNAYCDDA